MKYICPILDKECLGSRCYAFHVRKMPFREYYDEVKSNRGFLGITINKKIHVVKTLSREYYECTLLNNMYHSSEIIIEDVDEWKTVRKDFDWRPAARLYHYQPISEFKEISESLEIQENPNKEE